MHSHWPADKLSELSEKAKDSVYYSREQGWNRIAYCTLINNISEAIFHLSAGQQALETQLWQALAAAIEQWQLNESEQPELQAMLDGAPIPSKNNLTTRILKQADSLSSYSALKNPLAQLLEKS
jgi:siderophore synthetase component